MLAGDMIKDFARRNGIHAVGWFAAADFERYIATISTTKEYHAIVYRPLDIFLRAGRIPNGIRTVIVIVMDYFVESNDRPEGYRLSNYARACWGTVSPKARDMVGFLKSQRHWAEQLDVPHRAAACRAGLGFIGRNALFYAYGLGSYVGIASIGTDAEVENMENGAERVIHPNCENCQRCYVSCPVGAISSDGYKINPLRCLSFVNRHPDEPLRIPPEKSEQLERWLHGCETCQDVCPLNSGIGHKHEAVVVPEIRIEGMLIPNTATITKEIIESRIDAIKSSGYREYVRLLIGDSDERA